MGIKFQPIARAQEQEDFKVQKMYFMTLKVTNYKRANKQINRFKEVSTASDSAV